MPETWASLADRGYPDYSVSSWGRVMNERRGHVLNPTLNNAGFLKVALKNVDTGKFDTLSVTRLVADTFVEGRDDIFDTPIHLDGNKQHVYVDNLVWRPRWFARKYHDQFKQSREGQIGVQEIKSGEIFDTVREAAVKYGLLEIDIVMDDANQRGVFPTGHFFRLLTD